MRTHLLIFFFLMVAFTSCVAHTHPIVYEADKAGFFTGLWQGAISPITFLISLFSDHITVWETYNNGGWYTFGFLLGVGTLTSSSTKTVSK